MKNSTKKLKVLIFIVAYNAEKTILSTLGRIPTTLNSDYDIEVLVIDDCSLDSTAEIISRKIEDQGYIYPVTILRNPINQGYGGNQKIGYKYAISHQFDVAVLLHGDGQYAPEKIPDILLPFQKYKDSLGAVFGSRMLNKSGALKGGMPLYKFFGNQILTFIQNKILRSNLSEFHTGYRAYAIRAISSIPFEYNTNDFHFDTEIIIQLLYAGFFIEEVPIPTFYGDEVCHVNGIKYALDVLKTSLKARFIALGIFYDPKFDVAPPNIKKYVSKLNFNSTHSLAFNLINKEETILDLGCADGYFSEELNKTKKCKVTSVDIEEKIISGCQYIQCNLNQELPSLNWEAFDVVVMLDVIEHLADPENFLNRLRLALSSNRKVSVIMSSGNVCFFITRLMMLIGQFNYGKRGILDITHTRLFTVSSLERLLRYADFDIKKIVVVPAPYPLAIGLNIFSKSLLTLNSILARLAPGLFAYQTLIVAKPKPSIEFLLKNTHLIISTKTK
jgi:glycosyltransferase involved in cell wall biosynthesis